MTDVSETFALSLLSGFEKADKKKRKTKEKIYLLIGDIYTWKGDIETSPYLYNGIRKPEDCTGGIKLRYIDDDKTKVCLKEYNVKDIHPKDMDVIKKHVIHKAADGTPFYEFTRYHTLEEIKQEKIKLLKETPDFIDKENRIFSPAEKTINVPEQIIPAHVERREVWWDCQDDRWDLIR